MMISELDVLRIVSERLDAARIPYMLTGSEGKSAMNDTSPKIAAMVAERHRQMTPDERIRIASSMFDTARAIVESSLPSNLSRRERRLAYAKRMYGNELPQAALIAFAEWPEDR